MGCVNSTEQPIDIQRSYGEYVESATVSLKKAKQLDFTICFCIDISGSMNKADAINRKTGEIVSRMDAVIHDIHHWAKELKHHTYHKITAIHIITFGENVKVYENIGVNSIEDITSTLQANEQYTCTHLAILETNQLFAKRKRGSTFFDIYLTDGVQMFRIIF